MASSSLTIYTGSASSLVFTLVSTSEKATVWKVAGGNLSEPTTFEIIKKIGPSASLSNDHVVVRVQAIGKNVTTGKFATFSATLDISIPKDVSIHTIANQKLYLGAMASVLNESVALQATNVNRTALLDGRDL